MFSVINGFRKYNIDEKTGTTEDILAFYPESYINNGENYSSLKEEEIICDFIIKEKLGEGAFGSVRLGINKQTGEKVAIKILEKNKIKKYEDKLRIQREVDLLKKLRHPNIVRLYSIIETEKQILLITEYIKGKELFHYILLKKKLSEEEACYYFNQIVSGVEYLHRLKIAHRDIKSENLIIEQNTKLIKIIDFGLSNTYGDKDEEILRSSCGSPLYAAPEMLKGEYYKGSTVDIWSIGVVLFFMICGYLPFQDEDNSKLYKKIIQGKYTIPMHVSTQGRELLYNLMNINPRKRINLSQIKRHSWVKLYSNKSIDLNERVFQTGLNLDKYVIPIDEDIIEELSIKFNLPKIKLRINILMNKSNDYTTLYELLLNKKIMQGKKSVADLKSDLFLKYIRDKKNLMSNYNNDIKKVIKERKMGYDINNKENNELNKNFVKSLPDFHKNDFNINNMFKNDIKSSNLDNKIILNNTNQNILTLKSTSIIDTENKNKYNYSKNQILINNLTPVEKHLNKNKINNINSVKSDKIKNQTINCISDSNRRNKNNSLDKNLKNNYTLNNNINSNKNNNHYKKIRKNISLDITNIEKSKINKLLKNKQNSSKKDYINKANKRNDFSNSNTEIINEKIKKMLSESKIITTEDKNESSKEINTEKDIEKKERQENKDNLNNISNEQTSLQNDINNNSKLNNYLTSDEITKNAQTLDSFSLKNYNEDNLFTNFSIQNVNIISFCPKKYVNNNKNIKEKKGTLNNVQKKHKIYNNRINLMRHKSQMNYKENSIKQKNGNSISKDRSHDRISKSEAKRKYLKNRKTGVSPISKVNRLNIILNNYNDKLINEKENIQLYHNNSCELRDGKNKIVDTENFANKIKTGSIINIQKHKKYKIRKYNSIDNEFEHIKNKNLKLSLSINIERNKNPNLKRYIRNNKIYSSNTQINETLSKIDNNKRNTINSNKISKILKLNEKSNDLFFRRNISMTKSNTLLSDNHNKYYTSYKKDTSLDISNNVKKKIKIINDKNLSNDNTYDNIKSIISDNVKNKNSVNNYIPFDLSCIFISPRKQIKQKIVNIVEKMNYKIKNIKSYKFNIVQGDKIEGLFEINLPINKLGIVNFKKYRSSNIEQVNHIIKKILFKIK